MKIGWFLKLYSTHLHRDFIIIMSGQVLLDEHHRMVITKRCLKGLDVTGSFVRNLLLRSTNLVDPR